MKKVQQEFMAPDTVHFAETISNCGGIEIAVRDEQVAYCDCFNGKEEYCSRWQDIKVDDKGRMFFYWHGRKKYMDNFMRIDY